MVERIVGQYVEGDPQYFCKEFPVSFDLWETHSQARGFLIKPSGKHGYATLLSAHERMKKLFPTEEELLGVKLLVPREAREAVENLILGTR
jgi:hypothetical protein